MEKKEVVQEEGVGNFLLNIFSNLLVDIKEVNKEGSSILDSFLFTDLDIEEVAKFKEEVISGR